MSGKHQSYFDMPASPLTSWRVFRQVSESHIQATKSKSNLFSKRLELSMTTSEIKVISWPLCRAWCSKKSRWKREIYWDVVSFLVYCLWGTLSPHRCNNKCRSFKFWKDKWWQFLVVVVGICFIVLQRLPRHYCVVRYPLSNFLDDGKNEFNPTTHFNVGELLSWVTVEFCNTGEASCLI